MYEVKLNALNELYKRIDTVNYITYHPIEFKIESAEFIRSWRTYAIAVKLEYENNKTFATKAEVKKYKDRFIKTYVRFALAIKNMVYLEEKYTFEKLTDEVIDELSSSIYKNAGNSDFPDYSDFIVLILDRLIAIRELVLFDTEQVRFINANRYDKLKLILDVSEVERKEQENSIQEFTDDEI